MTPAEVKFALDAKLLSLARGGRVPVIASVHSAVLENNVVYVMYDIAGDDGLETGGQCLNTWNMLGSFASAA
jgi:hypothetical protein